MIGRTAARKRRPALLYAVALLILDVQITLLDWAAPAIWRSQPNAPAVPRIFGGEKEATPGPNR